MAKKETIKNSRFEFADVLKKARTDRKLSMSKVFELTGIAKGTLSHYENGTHEPNATNFARLCLFYDIPLENFIKK